MHIFIEAFTISNRKSLKSRSFGFLPAFWHVHWCKKARLNFCVSKYIYLLYYSSEPSANNNTGSVVVNIIRLCCDWLKYLQKDKISIALSCTGTLEGNQMVST